MSAIHVLRREQRLDAPPAAVFPFFADPRNLEAITPPLLRFRLLTPEPVAMGAGTFLQYALRLHGVPVRWDTLIQEWEPPDRFVDVQVRGPYRLWHHTHELLAVDGGAGTLMRDTVRYALPFGVLGEIARRAVVRRDLEAIFDFRRSRVPELIACGDPPGECAVLHDIDAYLHTRPRPPETPSPSPSRPPAAQTPRRPSGTPQAER